MGNCTATPQPGITSSHNNNDKPGGRAAPETNAPIKEASKRKLEGLGSSEVELGIGLVQTTDGEVQNGFSDQALQHWKVFNDLDTQDEADMMALASFFQKLSGSTLFKQVDMEHNDREVVALEHVRIDGVGRLDSVIHNLDDFQIPLKGKVTLETALDIIDCFRRGGKLHVQSVHKILKDAYWLLKKMPNIREANITEKDQRVTVVGDLHGQFADLLHILDTTENPSCKNLLIFNGDFVDRGPCSLQCILTLFALQLAEPQGMFLNRGNHEDAGICCVFGFMKECLASYDEVTFSMFVEVFRYLPLATIINGQVFVLHGGLFSQPGVLLEEVMEANRKDYNLGDENKKSRPASPTKGADDMEQKEYLDQLVRDMLWSDPLPSLGRRPNPRGEGVHFGPDITVDFLRENNLSMIVRSHECVPFGFGQPYEGQGKELLCTIFSASNYSMSGNHGAFLRFTCEPSRGCKEVKPVNTDPMATPAVQAPRGKKLYYTVNCYYLGDPSEQERCLREATQSSLVNLIMKKKQSLLRAFEESDNEKCGRLSVEAFSEVLTRVTRLYVQWPLLFPLLLSQYSSQEPGIDYNVFLNNFQVQYGLASSESGKTMFDALYVNRKQLEAMFAFFDVDKNGSISREEFKKGCDYLNQILPPDEQVTHIDRLLDLLDFDHSNSIELNEFFEAFRLLDLKDGKLDGSIDLPTEHYVRKKMTVGDRGKLFNEASIVDNDNYVLAAKSTNNQS